MGAILVVLLAPKRSVMIDAESVSNTWHHDSGMRTGQSVVGSNERAVRDDHFCRFGDFKPDSGVLQRVKKLLLFVEFNRFAASFRHFWCLICFSIEAFK